jgi:hypothetical protein
MALCQRAYFQFQELSESMLDINPAGVFITILWNRPDQAQRRAVLCTGRQCAHPFRGKLCYSLPGSHEKNLTGFVPHSSTYLCTGLSTFYLHASIGSPANTDAPHLCGTNAGYVHFCLYEHSFLRLVWVYSW